MHKEHDPSQLHESIVKHLKSKPSVFSKGLKEPQYEYYTGRSLDKKSYSHIQSEQNVLNSFIEAYRANPFTPTPPDISIETSQIGKVSVETFTNIPPLADYPESNPRTPSFIRYSKYDISQIEAFDIDLPFDIKTMLTIGGIHTDTPSNGTMTQYISQNPGKASLRSHYILNPNEESQSMYKVILLPHQVKDDRYRLNAETLEGYHVFSRIADFEVKRVLQYLDHFNQRFESLYTPEYAE